MTNKLPKTKLIPVKLINSNSNYIAYISICDFTNFDDSYKELDKFLHDDELEYYKKLTFEKRIKSYLIGRYTAKTAISAYLKENDLRKISISSGIFNHPIVTNELMKSVQVSISHSKQIASAISFNEKCPMGIDSEFIRSDNLKAIERYTKESEINIIKNNSMEHKEGLYLLWTAKEALSKALRIGFLSPISLFEISEIKILDSFFICNYKNFPMFSSISIIKYGFMNTITYPNKLDIKGILN